MQSSCARVPVLLLSLALGACLDDGGGSSPAAGSGPSTTAAVAGPTTAQPATTPGTPGAPAGGTTGSGTTVTSTGDPYARAPAIASCDAGMLKLEEKAAVLATLNEVRALHRLPAVAYDNTSDTLVQQSALLGVANGQISHSPPTSWYCYSPEGAQGSGQSNLYYAAGFSPASTAVIAEFLIDHNVSALGHRRWILHPFLSQTAFGRVDGIPFAGGNTRYAAMSLRVIGYPDAVLGSTPPEYVAYPEGNYPARYFRHGWFMSFSVLADPRRTFGNGADAVDFSQAAVTVSERGGGALATGERSHNYQGYGVPNVLQWKTTGTRNGVDYVVRISGVRVKGVSRDYEYGFRIE